MIVSMCRDLPGSTVATTLPPLREAAGFAFHDLMNAPLTPAFDPLVTSELPLCTEFLHLVAGIYTCRPSMPLSYYSYTLLTGLNYLSEGDQLPRSQVDVRLTTSSIDIYYLDSVRCLRKEVVIELCLFGTRAGMGAPLATGAVATVSSAADHHLFGSCHISFFTRLLYFTRRSRVRLHVCSVPLRTSVISIARFEKSSLGLLAGSRHDWCFSWVLSPLLPPE